MTRLDGRHDPATDGLCPAGTTGVNVDGVDRTDIDTQHTIDTLRLVCRVGLTFGFRVAGRIHPLEHVDRAVFETGAISQTDIEVDGDVRSVDAKSLGFLNGPPHIVPVMLADDLA